MVDKLIEAVRPRAAYLLCATPRSGSTLMCEMLARTGIAGRPREYFEALRATGRPRQPREYFAGVDDPDVLDLLPAMVPPAPEGEPFEARLRAVMREGTTVNGVFGAKLMWGHQADLQARLRLLPGLARLGPVERLAAVLGDVRYVFVRREDVVAQAISLWRAVQTEAWRAEEEDGHEPLYSFAGVDHLVRMLGGHDRSWRRWFRTHELEPLELRYEEIAGDPEAAVRRTLEHLGVAGELQGSLPEPHLRRQADEVSLAWAERYRQERAPRSRGARAPG
jgi:LPS sulfotransferase NodH